MHANHVTLILRSSTPEDPGLYINSGNVSTEGFVSYATHYYTLDPFVGLPPDQVVTVHEILGEAGWLESPLYKEYLAQLDVFHIMGGPIFILPMGWNADSAAADRATPKRFRKKRQGVLPIAAAAFEARGDSAYTPGPQRVRTQAVRGHGGAPDGRHRHPR
ncbi:hypothetical protein ACFS07_20435 [Undibacterium arcticum]